VTGRAVCWHRFSVIRPTVAVLLVALSTLAQAAVVHDVRLWRAPDHTRVVLDLSAPADFKVFTLDGPDRIVVDLGDTSLEASLDSLDKDLAETPIKTVRHGIREGDDLRLVLELSTGVDLKYFSLKATPQTDDRLVLDLYDRNPVAAPVTVKKSRTEADRRDILVAIDAGHGGEDPGALGPGRLREKDVVLAIARELHNQLEAERGIAPTLIRSGDYYVSLRGRRDLARKRQADLFVSIHADAFKHRSANGASVYALSLGGASSTTARYLADSENAADLIGGVRLADKDEMLAGVLADLSMTATLDHSLSVGDRVLRRMGGVARLHKKQVEQAGFAVLKSPDVPSILVETGFISNPTEARRLATRDYQVRMARAIRSGIMDWFRTHPPDGTLLAWERDQGGREYTIARGDTLSEIAQRFNVSVNALRDHNGIQGNQINAGQRLKIPAS
jgi:N-acetylmuramoyl-L-alanine amidase